MHLLGQPDSFLVAARALSSPRERAVGGCAALHPRADAPTWCTGAGVSLPTPSLSLTILHKSIANLERSHLPLTTFCYQPQVAALRTVCEEDTNVCCIGYAMDALHRLQLRSSVAAEARAALQVRRAPSWPRSWPNFSLV
jgi:hypothetical protein